MDRTDERKNTLMAYTTILRRKGERMTSNDKALSKAAATRVSSEAHLLVVSNSLLSFRFDFKIDKQ